MLGWKIFVHSLRMVFGNLRQVLQIAFGPAVLGAFVVFGLAIVLGAPLSVDDQAMTELGTGASSNISPAFAFVVVATVMGWIAVSWHRFVLLEEYPTGILPTFRSDRILAYILRLLLIGVIAGIAFLPAGFVFTALGGGLIGVSIILLVVYFLFLVVCGFRIAIVLPAAALGEPLTLKDALGKTAGATGSIIVLLIVSVVFQFLVDFLFTLLAFIPILGVLLVMFLAALVFPMINVSILTTMYGVFC